MTTYLGYLGKARFRLKPGLGSIPSGSQPSGTSTSSTAPCERRGWPRPRSARADLDIGRGRYANHPVHRVVLDAERAQQNVPRLHAALTLAATNDQATSLCSCAARIP